MPGRIRIGVFASGGGTNLQSIIDRCEDGRIDGDVVVVISDRAEARSLARARDHGITALHFGVPKTGTDGWLKADREIADALLAEKVDLVCLAGYMRITGPALLAEFPNAVMNIHPALLPAFKGMHGPRDALEYGCKVAGATVHFADAEFDMGPIIIQSAVPVREDDTEDSLAARILKTEYEIYSQAIQWFAQGRLSVEGRLARVKGTDAAGLIISDPS
ncbi:MAG TPA: phosphoribosylglycinamide formyltransferase [Armatimonadota bacterium]|nr:phosphoribosylglycinamide formyltransferase [Armatimonadota bacterium]